MVIESANYNQTESEAISIVQGHWLSLEEWRTQHDMPNGQTGSSDMPLFSHKTLLGTRSY